MKDWIKEIKLENDHFTRHTEPQHDELFTQITVIIHHQPLNDLFSNCQWKSNHFHQHKLQGIIQHLQLLPLFQVNMKEDIRGQRDTVMSFLKQKASFHLRL